LDDTDAPCWVPKISEVKCVLERSSEVKRLLICLLLCLLLLSGCSGPALPSAEEVPYRIAIYGEVNRFVYCDNYELGSSVVVKGFWEYNKAVFKPGYVYRDKLLIIDASIVEIEDRRKVE